jgi:transaldolase
MTALSSLEQLRKLTLIVADSGDLPSIKQWSPTDTTTNPSLLWQVAQQADQAERLTQLRQQLLNTASSTRRDNRHSPLSALVMQFAVKIGIQILQHIPGRISTEVSAALSFNINATQRAAHEIIDLYQRENIDADRILIKIAATWEGICAARLLEREGIHCNLTLVFNLMQAAACADAGITLISPFVGRISDWHQKHTQQAIDYHQPDSDPGVQSVKQIYHYLKQRQYPTEVMAASFRHPQQAIALAGCDAMTLSPKILQELDQLQQPVDAYITHNPPQNIKDLHCDEVHFRWAMNQDEMANNLLADGIRRFDQDERRLKALLGENSGETRT